jgi:DNA-binding beta-propeller fold protein YncE
MHRGRKRSGNSFRILFPLLVAALVQLTHPAPSQAAGVDKGVISIEFLYSIEYTAGKTEKLREPMDLHFDPQKNELYVVDAGTRKIMIYDNNGMFIQDIPIYGDTPSMFAVDKGGDIYVGYTSSPKISHLDYRGNHIEDIILPGIVDVPGNTIRPMRLVSGADGSVYARGAYRVYVPFGRMRQSSRRRDGASVAVSSGANRYANTNRWGSSFRGRWLTAGTAGPTHT